MVDEAERSLHDALSVLWQTVKETRILGGGCSEMLVSYVVEGARQIKGKKAIATEAFNVRWACTDDIGYNAGRIFVTRLRAAHYEV